MHTPLILLLACNTKSVTHYCTCSSTPQHQLHVLYNAWPATIETFAIRKYKYVQARVLLIDVFTLETLIDAELPTIWMSELSAPIQVGWCQCL